MNDHMINHYLTVANCQAIKTIKKGVPIRVEIGPKEIETNSVEFFRRDNIKELKVIKRKEFVETAVGILEDIQASLLKKAISFRKKNIFEHRYRKRILFFLF